MRVRRGNVLPSFAWLEHCTQGLVHSYLGVSKEQSCSPHPWIYCP